MPPDTRMKQAVNQLNLYDFIIYRLKLSHGICPAIKMNTPTVNLIDRQHTLANIMLNHYYLLTAITLSKSPLELES